MSMNYITVVVYVCDDCEHEHEITTFDGTRYKACIECGSKRVVRGTKHKKQDMDGIL